MPRVRQRDRNIARVIMRLSNSLKASTGRFPIVYMACTVRPFDFQAEITLYARSYETNKL